MKIKYLTIFLFFIYRFLFVKSDCYLINNERPETKITKLRCDDQIIPILLNSHNRTETTLEKDTDGKYYFDIINFPYKNRLCDYSYDIYFLPEIPSLPSVPTTGQSLNFTYNYPCTSVFGRIKPLNIGNQVVTPSNVIGSLDLFTMKILQGCGDLILSSDSRVIYNTSYQTGVIPNKPTIDDQGNINIQGSNLYNTQIKINSNDPVENLNPTGKLDATHSTIVFSLPESQYQGNWTIDVTICEVFYKSYLYTFLPIITIMEGVLNDNGGNITFTGDHLSVNPTTTISGHFGGKPIDCFSGTPKSVICTIPSRSEYGGSGYDVPLNVTIGKYTTNTIKISYDLPLIQGVSQRGTSQIFDVSGVYFSGVISMTIITGANIKTNIIKKPTATLEEPGFFIESNNTIFIFLPNNTQPGFMNLIVGDGGSKSFISPRYNFKITPTITAGQSFKSNTIGGDLKISGIFMRTVDSDGRDVPLTVKSEPGGPICDPLKDGDGLFFTCVLKSGFGSSHTMNVYYNLLQIGSFVISYNPPYLASSDQEKDGTIQINGNNLGESINNSILTVVYSDGSRVNGTVIKSSHNLLTFQYPVGNRNTASYVFQLGDQVSNMAGPFTLKPIIENNNPAVPCGGGMVTINGHYFFNYTKNTTTITIGKVPCNISSINVTTIECIIVPNLKSLSPYYTSGSKPLIISSSNPFTEKVYQSSLSGYSNYTFAPPTITNTSDIDQTALITIYGTSFGDANLEILIDGKPCTQPEINIHTYSSLTCNVTNYDEMLKYNYSNTKFNISISVDGQYFIAEIFQFKYESTISYSEDKSSGFPNEMYIGIVAIIIFLALIFFAIKTQVEKYIEERRARKAFRSVDNLRLKLREKHAAEIAKHYSFGYERAPKPNKSYFYDLRKKLSRLPLIRCCFKEHSD
ncbi:hypothetical protein ACTFIZ_011312 [Dictyostelium cf. discoideum]